MAASTPSAGSGSAGTDEAAPPRKDHIVDLGAPELIIILVIVLLLFGAKKLPDLAGSMGKSIKEFRKAAEEADADETSTNTTNTAAADDTTES